MLLLFGMKPRIIISISQIDKSSIQGGNYQGLFCQLTIIKACASLVRFGCKHFQCAHSCMLFSNNVIISTYGLRGRNISRSDTIHDCWPGGAIEGNDLMAAGRTIQSNMIPVPISPPCRLSCASVSHTETFTEFRGQWHFGAVIISQLHIYSSICVFRLCQNAIVCMTY